MDFPFGTSTYWTRDGGGGDLWAHSIIFSVLTSWILFVVTNASFSAIMNQTYQVTSLQKWGQSVASYRSLLLQPIICTNCQAFIESAFVLVYLTHSSKDYYPYKKGYLGLQAKSRLLLSIPVNSDKCLPVIPWVALVKPEWPIPHYYFVSVSYQLIVCRL